MLLAGPKTRDMQTPPKFCSSTTTKQQLMCVPTCLYATMPCKLLVNCNIRKHTFVFLCLAVVPIFSQNLPFLHNFTPIICDLFGPEKRYFQVETSKNPNCWENFFSDTNFPEKVDLLVSKWGNEVFPLKFAQYQKSTRRNENLSLLRYQNHDHFIEKHAS